MFKWFELYSPWVPLNYRGRAISEAVYMEGGRS